MNALLLAQARTLYVTRDLYRMAGANSKAIYYLKRRGMIDSDDHITDRGRAALRKAPF